MNRREKIIVSVMAVTVLLGGYIYFGPVTTASRQKIAKQSEGWDLDFAQQVIHKLKEDTTLSKDLFTIRSAERKWEKDPFLPTDTLLSDTQPRNASDKATATAAAGTQPAMAYTGFLEVGLQRLAIINGIEYASGEAIDDRGHYVRRIHPHQVEIGKLNEPGVTILKLMDYAAISGK